MRSLWMRMTGAFVLIVLLYGVVNIFLVNKAAQEEFSQYTSQTGIAWAERLAPALEEYYAENGSWQGVSSVLQSPTIGMSPMMMGNMSPEMSAGMMDISGLWDMMGFQLCLVDAQGTVQMDTSGGLVDIQLTPSDLKGGIPLRLENTQIGVLLALDTSLSPNSVSNNFVRTLNASVWQASLITTLFAVLIGSMLFRQIIAPVRAVTDAARKIAAGNLEQRVLVDRNDEVGQMAQTFNQMADALEHDRQLRRNMTADIAHELRTPLSVIQGNLEAMLDDVLPMNAEEISSLHEETVLLTRLVADLHLLSLADAGQLHLNLNELDLAALLKQIAASLRPMADSLHVEIVMDFPKTCPILRLDSDRTSQIIHNLLSNALRYTPAGGTITMRIRLTAQSVLVDISDTGAGIPEDALAHIFDRFYRAEKSRNRASGGSGIGLAIVKQLMQAQGGDVSVKSPCQMREDGSGFGSCFTLEFPI
ncbi:MAG: ATP-binding protein [Anaerolineales bacterium]|nr:ATP-binding protein [Anaerolineales bacterium]